MRSNHPPSSGPISRTLLPRAARRAYRALRVAGVEPADARLRLIELAAAQLQALGACVRSRICAAKASKRGRLSTDSPRCRSATTSPAVFALPVCGRLLTKPAPRSHRGVTPAATAHWRPPLSLSSGTRSTQSGPREPLRKGNGRPRRSGASAAKFSGDWLRRAVVGRRRLTMSRARRTLCGMPPIDREAARALVRSGVPLGAALKIAARRAAARSGGSAPSATAAPAPVAVTPRARVVNAECDDDAPPSAT